MTITKIYSRLLAELNYKHASRSTVETRLALQDVLAGLRERAATEQGIGEEAAQDCVESVQSEGDQS